MAKSVQTTRVIVSALAGLTSIGLSANTARAQDGADGSDWPQWRGPTRDGLSSETAWSSTGKTDALWTKELGFGHSSFAVQGDRVYTLGFNVDEELDRIYCFNAATGEEVWRHEYAAKFWDIYHDGGTQTTPTVVGDAVYTSNREGKLFCFDAATGDVRWSHDLREEYELEPPTWGFSASPLIVDDRLFMNLGQVLAFDRTTGKEVWKTAENHGIAYSTPAPFEVDGNAYLASFTGDGLAVINRTNGTEIAFYPWAKNPFISPMTPVVVGNKLFISAGYDHGCAMVEFDGDALTELWASRKMRNKMSGCVLYEDHLYGFDESILKCLDLEGKEMWRKRGLGTGSMSIAGGRLVIIDGKGQMVIAEANPSEYVELSKQRVLSGGTYWSTPVLSHGLVYVRNSLGQMACLDYRGDGASATSTSNRDTQAAPLPSAAAIIARHTAAVGGKGAASKLRSIHMTGQGESLRNIVRKEEITVDWRADSGFTWRDASGFNIGFNNEYAWIVGSGSPPLDLKEDANSAILRAGDFRALFDLAAGYTWLRSKAATTFDGRECFAVEGVTKEGYTRMLFFEVESGLYAGMQGEGVHMWTLRDYKEIDGITLPTTWAFFEPIEGEMDSATFDTIEINADVETARFETPSIIRLMNRSPDEVAAANKQLTIDHAEILGDWVYEGAPAGSPPTVFDVADGFLRSCRPGSDPDNLSEPDENGRLVIIGVEYVGFTPKRDDEGNIVGLQLTVAGETRGLLKRADD